MTRGQNALRAAPFKATTLSLVANSYFSFAKNFLDLTNRYVITELLQSDLHKIIVSPQHLSVDHIKVFLYQILRGE